MAGDEYEGSVWVNGVDLWVRKQHVFCEPWDTDEHYEGRDRDEEIEAFEEDEYDLPMAA